MAILKGARSASTTGIGPLGYSILSGSVVLAALSGVSERASASFGLSSLGLCNDGCRGSLSVRANSSLMRSTSSVDLQVGG